MQRMRTVFLSLLLAVATVSAARAGDRPNIVYIMSDDHAAHAIGAYGSHVNTTPNLDRIAREGAILTSVFATNSRQRPGSWVPSQTSTRSPASLKRATAFNGSICAW